jgi:mannosyltransferase OCH1-like enzyme
MQYWDQTNPPAGITQLLRTWVESHPGYSYCRFDDTTAREYLGSHYPETILNAYRRASHPAQKSDLFRLAYLFREGGFYVDADDRCVGSLASIVPRDAVFLLYQEQYATLGNNFIGCIAEDPVIGRALTLAVEALLSGDSDTIWLATGPGLMTRAFAQVLVGQGTAWRDWLRTRRVFDRGELSAVSWPHSISLYKTTRRGWLNNRFSRIAPRELRENAE